MDIPSLKQIGDVLSKQGEIKLISKCSTSIMEIVPSVDHKARVWGEPDAVLEAWLVANELETVLTLLKHNRMHCGPAHMSWSLKQWLYRTEKPVWTEFLHSRCHLFMYGV